MDISTINGSLAKKRELMQFMNGEEGRKCNLFQESVEHMSPPEALLERDVKADGFMLQKS